MKRCFTIIFVLAMVFASGCGTSGVATRGTAVQEAVSKPTAMPDYDFRNTTWGMTMDQVESSETAELMDKDQNALLYSVEDVAGLPATLVYGFQNEELTLASYSFEVIHSNANDYINDYDNLKAALTEVYGFPITDKQVWKDDLFKDDPSSYGLAISAGQLVYVANWKTDTTNIILGIDGDNYEISLILMYTTLNYNPDTNTGGL